MHSQPHSPPYGLAQWLTLWLIDSYAIAKADADADADAVVLKYLDHLALSCGLLSLVDLIKNPQVSQRAREASR